MNILPTVRVNAEPMVRESDVFGSDVSHRLPGGMASDIIRIISKGELEKVLSTTGCVLSCVT